MKAASFLFFLVLYGLIASLQAQQLPESKREEFLSFAKKNSALDVYKETKILLDSYPDDERLRSAHRYLAAKLPSNAKNQLSVIGVWGGHPYFGISGTCNNRISSQVFKVSREFPRDWIEEHRKKGFVFQGTGATDDGWLLVMSKGWDPEIGQRSWWALGPRVDDKREKEEDKLETKIAEQWKNGMEIIGVARGKEIWFVMFGDREGWDGKRQRFTCTPNWPQNWINARNKEGYKITSVCSGIQDGQWHYFIVMSAGSGVPEYALSDANPKDWVGKKSGGGWWHLTSQFWFDSGQSGSWLELYQKLPYAPGGWKYLATNIGEISSELKQFRDGTVFEN